MKKLLNECLRERKNGKFDLFLVMAFVAFFVYFTIAIILTFQGKLSLVEFSSGFGVISSVMSAIYKLKKETKDGKDEDVSK